MNTKTLTRLLTLLLVVVTCATMPASCATKQKEAKYEEAFALIEQGSYEEAYAIFAELGDFKDAKTQLTYFRHIPTTLVSDAVYFDEDGETSDHYTLTVTLDENNLPAQVVTAYLDGYTHTCTHSYDETGRLLSILCIDSDGDESTFIRTYDEQGRVIKEVDSAYGYSTATEITYDDKGREHTQTVLFNSDSQTKQEFVYDENDRVCKVLYTDYDGVLSTIAVVYNENDKPLTKTETLEDGTLVGVETYTYDDKGREIKFEYKTEDEYFSTLESTYNDKDQLIRSVRVLAGEYTYTDEYEYDEHGCEIVNRHTIKASYEGDNTTESTYTLTYIPFDYTEEEWEQMLDWIRYR